MELEEFMVKASGLSLEHFKQAHVAPSLVFTPHPFYGFGSGAQARVDTPESKVIRLDHTGSSRLNLKAFTEAVYGGGPIEFNGTDTHADEEDSVPARKRPTPASGRLYKVEKSEANPFAQIITIGRAKNNDIVIDHNTVSKVHAFLSCVGGVWRIADQSSTNKTYLNGAEILPVKYHELHDNDKLSFGRDSYATFFMPESLWNFMKLCVALSRSDEKAKAKTKKSRAAPPARDKAV